MGRPARLPDSVREQDLKDVVRVWREVGHTPKSIDQYRLAVIEILERGRAFDYHEITADRVDSWAQQYAVERGLDPARVMRRWLPAFRAFAWGLQQIGKATGPVVRSKPQAVVDLTVEAFMKYGRSLGWKERTLLLHLRSLRELQHHLSCHRGKWPEPRLQDIDDFLKVAAQRWKRTTVAGAAEHGMRFAWVGRHRSTKTHPDWPNESRSTGKPCPKCCCAAAKCKSRSSQLATATITPPSPCSAIWCPPQNAGPTHLNFRVVAAGIHCPSLP